MATIDPTPARDAFGYFITFTSPNGFSEAQEDQIVQFHKRKCENCLLVTERHADGRKHYHSSILVMKPKTTNGMTRQVANLYKAMEIEVVGRVTFQVKKVSDQVGSFWYLLKEQEDDQLPLLLMGWKMEWIKEQCKSNIKKIPRRMLMKDRVVLNSSNSIPYCLRFAEAAGMGITGKESFKNLVKLMVKDSYSFDNVKIPWLYSQLMCIAGDDRALDTHLDNCLFGL